MRLLVITLFLVVLSFNTISAQDDDDTRWYWAVSETTGALMAYTADGDVNTLIEDAIELVGGWRIDDENALVHLLFRDSDQLHLYRLTSDEAQSLTLDFDTSGWIARTNTENPIYFDASMNFFLGASSSHHALLSVEINPSNDLREGFSGRLLIDLDSYDVELIEPREGGLSYCIFSLDETLLHCDVEDWNEELQYSTWRERMVINLADGQTTYYETLLSAAEQLETYGRIWRYYRQDWEISLAKYGCEYDTWQEVYEICGLAEMVQDNHLFVYDRVCRSNCVLDMHTLGSAEPIQFELPPGEARVGAQILPSGRLFSVWQGSEVWILDANNIPEQIGHITIWCSHRTPGSDPYERWSLIEVGERSSHIYNVWDYRSERVVAEGSVGCPKMIYDDEGFIVHERSNNFAPVFFFDADQSITELYSRWEYFEIVSDNALLTHPKTMQNTPEAIYRYDIESDTYTLLVADGCPLLLPPLENRDDGSVRIYFDSENDCWYTPT